MFKTGDIRKNVGEETLGWINRQNPVFIEAFQGELPLRKSPIVLILGNALRGLDPPYLSHGFKGILETKELYQLGYRELRKAKIKTTLVFSIPNKFNIHLTFPLNGVYPKGIAEEIVMGATHFGWSSIFGYLDGHCCGRDGEIDRRERVQERFGADFQI